VRCLITRYKKVVYVQVCACGYFG